MSKRALKLPIYAIVGGLCMLAGLLLGRVEAVALGAPFALYLILGLAGGRPGSVVAQVSLDCGQAVEGEEVAGRLALRGAARTCYARVGLVLPSGVREITEHQRLLFRLGPNEERTIPLRLVCDRWGVYRLGDLEVSCRDAFGLMVQEEAVAGECVLKVYPRRERLRAAIAPFETELSVGSRVSRASGEGIEFAEIRPYVPGDRPRRINWHASSVGGSLFVNEQHPERSSDVILFLDTFSEAGRGSDTILTAAVRAAASLARHYLTVRDRVGIVGFGGVVRWLYPAAGETQWYRIVETLLETESVLSFAWKDLEVLPKQALPPQALVIAISPLLDPRTERVLLDIRKRGFDLVVVEVSPIRFVETRNDPLADLAVRLWTMHREALRYRYAQSGVTVAEWDGQAPLAALVEEVRSSRRLMRHVFA